MYTRVRQDCTLFQGALDTSGYGLVKKSGRLWTAHRWVWTERHGPIPAGLCVLHTCDIRVCINLDHLFLGTRSDNIQDMVRKGRARGGGTKKAPRSALPQLRGLNPGNRKLTPASVAFIRGCFGFTQQELGQMFGVGAAAIRRAQKGITW